jgi:DNA uptake protein ComE-like DNA-binding protein
MWGILGGGPGRCKAGDPARFADALVLAAVLGAGLLLCGVSALARRAALDAAGPPPDAADVVHRVDLDRADATELRLLPGVGPRLAGRLVAEREARGPFLSPGGADRRVRGVGPAMVRSWRGRVEDDEEGEDGRGAVDPHEGVGR